MKNGKTKAGYVAPQMDSNGREAKGLQQGKQNRKSKGKLKAKREIVITSVTEKLIGQLKKANLTLEDRTALTTALLDKLKALPLNSSIIVEDSRNIIINGKLLEVEQLINFRDGCIALRDNFARKVIREQIRYLAVNLGVYKATALDELMFYKAALWNLAEEDRLLDKILS